MPTPPSGDNHYSVGTLTYTRHEYFRRLLCIMLGNDIEHGLLPNDIALVGNMVEDISYRNARLYFGFYDNP